MPLFGSHGVTHSTQQRHSPRSGGLGEGQKALAGPGSAAQALEEAGELLLMEDQELIQACSPHASQKALTDSVCSWRTVRRSKHLDAARCCFELCWLLSISVPKKNANDGSTGSFSLQFMKQ